jgi:integrase
MGRPRTKNRDLPPGMHRKQGRYYYGQNDLALGSDLVVALRRWAELHGERVYHYAPTLADAIREYRRVELPKKSPKTQKDYGPQLVLLDKVFGKMALGEIKPADVKGYMRRRPAISGTREKALLSALFNFARGEGMTGAPNPCAGVKGTKAKRDVYIYDATFAAVWEAADVMTRDAMDLALLTGQRPGDTTAFRETDIRDGHLEVLQGKTGKRLRIAVVGELKAVVNRIAARKTTFPVHSLALVVNEHGQPLTYAGLRKRFEKAREAAAVVFDKAGKVEEAAAARGFQFRDLRAKAATDLESSERAQKLLGHSTVTTTEGYIRGRRGDRVMPLERGITDKTPRITDKKKPS